MKILTQFLKFAADPFFKGKVLTVIGFREYDTKAKLGWIDDMVITADNTSYKCKDGLTATNLYEKVSLKMEGQALCLHRRFRHAGESGLHHLWRVSQSAVCPLR